nr:uncharacterized protein LOC108128831 isoform X1 [Drosophila bipectinata]
MNPNRPDRNSCTISRTNSQTYFFDDPSGVDLSPIFDSDLFPVESPVNFPDASALFASNSNQSSLNELQNNSAGIVALPSRIYVSDTGTWTDVNKSYQTLPERHDSDEEYQSTANEASLGSAPEAASEGIEKAVADTGDLTTEPMAFLQGLNSGNLMQFSQQSVLREMILQDIQAQVSTLPKIEKHNTGGYNFSFDLVEPPKSDWTVSKTLNKLYIRMNKVFNVDIQFKARMPIQPLNLRVFLCFVKDVSGPVLRCQNHLSVEPLTDHNEKERENLLRCLNPNTIYCGTAQGKGISERYSVLVPLNVSRSGSRSGGYVRQTLAFNFVCQNSCFGRKESCLVFCLENASGDIVGQDYLNVKVCTCPKRDHKQEERQKGALKRKIHESDTEEDDTEDHPPKSRRLAESMHIKEETASNDSYNATHRGLPQNWDVSQTDNGKYQLSITVPNKEWLLDSIEGMVKEAATKVLRSPNKDRLRSYAQSLLKLKKRAYELP